MENAVINPYQMGGQIWNWLQELREEVTQELIDEEPLFHNQPDANRDERSLAAESGQIDWIHRSQLEARLREITDAQDRLLDSTYGKCVDCGDQISAARLAVDPAVAVCVSCKHSSEAEHSYATL